MAEKEEKKEINVFESGLVPEHVVLSNEERERILEELNVAPRQLPKIRQSDPVVKQLGAKKGDIMRIRRNDPVVGEHFYYRVVV